MPIKKNRKLRVLQTEQPPPHADDRHERPINFQWGSSEERREHLKQIIQKMEKQNGKNKICELAPDLCGHS